MAPSDTSKDRVYQEIRRSIVLGRLESGQKLPLEELAERYSTSVTPVREALQMLVQEGLVTARPHQGFFVTRMTLKELTDLLDLRLILEKAAVELAAPQITDSQLEELEAIHTSELSGDDLSYERAVNENRQFHILVASASGNQELAQAVGRIHDRLARFLVFIHPPDEVEKRHASLIQALRSHDADLASQVIEQEITETRQITLSTVIEQEGTAWYLGRDGG